MLRVDRLLSSRMSLDRKQVKHLIARKKVMAVIDGQQLPVNSPSEKHCSDSCFLVSGSVIKEPPKLIKFNKPKGMLSVITPSLDRPNISSMLPITLPEYYEFDKSLFHPVGRLDNDSSGLLLFSSDGQLTHRLLHPNFHVEKEYNVEVEGSIVDGSDLVKTLSAGVQTKTGQHAATDVQIEDISTVRLTVTEGKSRMVRRMLFNSGYPVLDLKRVRVGGISLGDLQEGEFSVLTPQEGNWIANEDNFMSQ